MTPEQWRQVRELFEQGLDRPVNEVASWLDRETVDDEVAAEVRSLLRHHSEAGEFLAEPVAVRVPSLLADDPLTPGTTIGAYTVIREIGRGGMGRVYEGRDERLGRSVALKTLPGGLAGDPSRRERLRREARAAALLTHPGICTVHALEEHDDTLVVVTELVDGSSLRDEIASRRAPSAAEVEDTMRQLAAALAHAHQAGITHRDLKPENIMRTRDGRVKILDFGLALFDEKMMPSDAIAATRITQPGTFIGTPGYMAPEQLTEGRSDPRSDIFSLGVLLYEFSAGVHPFQAATPLALAARVLEAEPRPLYTLRPDLPPALVNVVARSVDKSPDVRFQTAGDIVEALAVSDPRAAPTAPGSDTSTWWRTHQIVVLALYGVAVTLAWQIKEWRHGATDTAFLILGVLATTVGVFRGHLLFTEQQNRAALASERRRAARVTLLGDLLIAVVLAFAGWMVTPGRPLVALLAMALAIGIGLARLVVEQSTTRAAFGE